MIAASRIVVFIVVQVTLTYSFVFRSSDAEVYGRPLYFYHISDIRVCLRSCYDEMSCTYVVYRRQEGLCELYAKGNEIILSKGVYKLSRQETDSTCQALQVAPEIAFQKYPKDSQQKSSTKQCHNASEFITFKTFYSNNFSFYFEENSMPPMEGISTKYRLRFSKVTGMNCSSIPVFVKTLPRRFYFGSIYNTTGYSFANAYAFADNCVSNNECLGTEEIQEYVDVDGNYIYDKPLRSDLKDSGLNQTFYVVSVQTK